MIAHALQVRYSILMRSNKATHQQITRIFQNPKYRGKHVVYIAGKVFATDTGKAKTKLLEKLLQEYPREIPTILYIPKVDSLVLILE